MQNTGNRGWHFFHVSYITLPLSLSSFIPLQLLYCIYCNMNAEDFSINNRTAVTSVTSVQLVKTVMI